MATRSALPSLTQRSTRQFLSKSPRWTSPRPILKSSFSFTRRHTPTTPLRTFTNTPIFSKGITPDSSDPQPKQAEASIKSLTTTEISIDTYHGIADETMSRLLVELEELQEDREDVDVEYSAGVLNLVFPPNGTYVINKQPPNKQIWLSSPISGPKRYDWVLLGEGQDQKEGGGKGEWIYLRDGSTLTELMRKEVGIDLADELES